MSPRSFLLFLSCYEVSGFVVWPCEEICDKQQLYETFFVCMSWMGRLASEYICFYCSQGLTVKIRDGRDGDLELGLCVFEVLISKHTLYSLVLMKDLLFISHLNGN